MAVPIFYVDEPCISFCSVVTMSPVSAPGVNYILIDVESVEFVASVDSSSYGSVKDVRRLRLFLVFLRSFIVGRLLLLLVLSRRLWRCFRIRLCRMFVLLMRVRFRVILWLLGILVRLRRVLLLRRLLVRVLLLGLVFRL